MLSPLFSVILIAIIHNYEACPVETFDLPEVKANQTVSALDSFFAEVFFSWVEGIRPNTLPRRLRKNLTVLVSINHQIISFRYLKIVVNLGPSIVAILISCIPRSHKRPEGQPCVAMLSQYPRWR